MIFKQKEKPKENNKSDCICCETVLERKIKHTKSIVGEKLYDTEKSILISWTQDNRLLFATEKGNYFSCDTDCYNYITCEENKTINVHETIYTDIRPETTEYAKENIGRYKPDKYIELFGEVEEA